MHEGNTLSNLGLLHHMQDRAAEAVAVSEAALPIARELGHARLECTLLCNLGIFETALERAPQARQRLEAALSLARRLPDPRLQGQALGYLAALHTRQCEFEFARVRLHEGQAVLEAAGDPFSLGVLLCVHAELECRCGRPDAASAMLERAGALAAEVRAGPRSELGLALARSRELALAFGGSAGLSRSG